MKHIITILSIFALILFESFTFRATTNVTNITKRALIPTTDIDGKAIFMSKGCIVCHANKENSIGPNTKLIAKAYKGKKEQLIKFLNKEAKPIIAPEDFAIMNANLFITKKLSDAEREALADYLLSEK